MVAVSTLPGKQGLGKRGGRTINMCNIMHVQHNACATWEECGLPYREQGVTVIQGL